MCEPFNYNSDTGRISSLFEGSIFDVKIVPTYIE